MNSDIGRADWLLQTSILDGSSAGEEGWLIPAGEP